MHILNKRASYGPESYGNFLNSSNGDSNSRPHLGWNFPPEDQHLVHPHWRGYPVPEIYHIAFLFIGYFTMLFVSLFGNGLVIWIFATSKNLRTPSNLLIINLAVFDLIMWMDIPMYLVNSTYGRIVGGEMACLVYAVCGTVSGLGSAISNAFIAFDRYKTISNPIDGRLNYLQVGFLIILSWFWTIPFTLLPAFKIWGDIAAEGFLTTCTFDYITDTDEIRFFMRTLFVWAYVIPMVLIVLNYTKLFLHVRNHERMLAEQAKKMNVKSLSANQDKDVEMRIAKVAMMLYMLYVFSWTPYATVAMLATYDYRHLITPFVSMLPASFAKVGSCIDPWVYAASHPKYRSELERRLPWLGIREKSTPSSNSAASAANSEAGTVSMDN